MNNKEKINRLKNLVSFLAGCSIDGYKVALEMCSVETGDEVREIMGKYPIIQTTRVQNKIDQIGKIPVDHSKLADTIEAIINGEM